LLNILVPVITLPDFVDDPNAPDKYMGLNQPTASGWNRPIPKGSEAMEVDEDKLLGEGGEEDRQPYQPDP